MLKALHQVALGKMKLPRSSDVGLSIHISDYQLEQGHLTDRSCAHALALLEITCTMHTKYFSLGKVLFDESNQSVYLKRYLQEQSDVCKMAHRLMEALDRFVNMLYEKIEIKSLVFGKCDKDDDDDIVIDLRDHSD